MKILGRTALLVAGLAVAAPALAHTVWLVPESGTRQQGWHVLFGGHAGVLNPYSAEKLKTVSAVAVDGRALAVSRVTRSDGVHLMLSGPASLILAHYDNGIHTKRRDGPSVERPMNLVPTAISASQTIKYHKTIAAWAPIVTRAAGQPFELVPLSAAQPEAGKPMLIKVLIGGRPAPGIKVSRNEEGQDAVTDANGVARFVPQRGFNKVWSGKRTPVRGNPAFTEQSIEYSLGFFAK